MAALLVPIHIFLDGLAVPLGLLDANAGDFGRMQSLIANPFIKLYLFVLVVLPLYHAAHRIRFSLYELGFRKFGKQCYIFFTGFPSFVRFYHFSSRNCIVYLSLYHKFRK